MRIGAKVLKLATLLHFPTYVDDRRRYESYLVEDEKSRSAEINSTHLSLSAGSMPNAGLYKATQTMAILRDDNCIGATQLHLRRKILSI